MIIDRCDVMAQRLIDDRQQPIDPLKIDDK